MNNNDLDRILGALNAAQPDERFEARLRARIAAHTAAPGRTRWNYAWLTVPALAAIIVAATLVHRTHVVATLTPQIATVAPAQAAPPPRTAIVPHPTMRLTHSDVGTEPKPDATDVAFLPSMPAPALPLSKDERILRRMASPQSPALLAQVEPMREMARREAAEAAASRYSYSSPVAPLIAPLTADDESHANSTPSAPTSPDLTTTTENQ